MKRRISNKSLSPVHPLIDLEEARTEETIERKPFPSKPSRPSRYICTVVLKTLYLLLVISLVLLGIKFSASIRASVAQIGALTDPPLDAIKPLVKENLKVPTSFESELDSGPPLATIESLIQHDKQFHALAEKERVSIRIKNDWEGPEGPEDVLLYWKSRSGDEVLVSKITAGAEVLQHTFVGHVFIARSSQHEFLKCVIAVSKEQNTTFTFTDSLKRGFPPLYKTLEVFHNPRALMLSSSPRVFEVKGVLDEDDINILEQMLQPEHFDVSNTRVEKLSARLADIIGAPLHEAEGYKNYELIRPVTLKRGKDAYLTGTVDWLSPLTEENQDNYDVQMGRNRFVSVYLHLNSDAGGSLCFPQDSSDQPVISKLETGKVTVVYNMNELGELDPMAKVGLCSEASGFYTIPVFRIWDPFFTNDLPPYK